MQLEKNIENDIRNILGIGAEGEIPVKISEVYLKAKRAADRANVPFGKPRDLLMVCLMIELFLWRGAAGKILGDHVESAEKKPEINKKEIEKALSSK